MFILAVCVFCQTSVTRLTVCWFKIPAQQNSEKSNASPEDDQEGPESSLENTSPGRWGEWVV